MDYTFVGEDRFDEMIRAGELLEWAQVFGHHYGTPRAPVEAALVRGRDVLFDIDWQGTQQLREKAPDAVLIFLMPPSFEELERRLRSRGTEDEQRIEERLRTARWELEQTGWFDHVVVNDESPLTRALFGSGNWDAAQRVEFVPLFCALRQSA